MTGDGARAMAMRATVRASTRALLLAAVFYNTRLALYLCLLYAVVHFLPGRVDAAAEPDPERGR